MVGEGSAILTPLAHSQNPGNRRRRRGTRSLWRAKTAPRRDPDKIQPREGEDRKEYENWRIEREKERLE